MNKVCKVAVLFQSSLHALCLCEGIDVRHSSATWHMLTFHTDRLLCQFMRPNLQLLLQIWFSINIFQYTLLHSHTSQLDHLPAPCSNQCSGISNSVLCWCYLHCVQDNELSFYIGKGILRQIFPLWSLVATRFFKNFQHEIRGS